MSASVSVFLSLASDSSESIKFIIIKLGRVTACTKCSKRSESVQALPITFAVKIVRQCILRPMTLTFTRYHNCVSKLTNVYLLGHYVSYGIQIWHTGRRMRGIHAHAHVDGLDLDARSQWLGRGKNHR